MKETLQKHPLAVEAVAAGLVLSLYLVLAFQAADSTAFYLGGDTTRDASRIVELLRTGHFSHRFGVPYESGYFPLIHIPFIMLFGNTILALQAASLSVGIATVLVLYAWLRRSFGLLPALCIGGLYATSPLLLAHFSVNVEMNMPLMLGIVMLLRTFDARSARTIAMALAGFFVSCNAYFILPLGAYLCSELFLLSGRQPGRAEALRSLGGFLAGMCFFGFKFLSEDSLNHQFGAAEWGRDFFRLNMERWRHPWPLFQNFWAQWTAGLAFYRSYMPWVGSPPRSWVIWAWAITCLMAVYRSAESRRWAIGLAVGLLGAALVQSVRGVGLRHMLVFLPLQWAFLAALLASFQSPRIRAVLSALIILIVAKQSALCSSALRAEYAISNTALLDADLAARLASMTSANKIHVDGTSNAFFCLKYLAPEQTISIDEGTEPDRKTGIIHIGHGAHGPLRTLTLVPRLHFNDGVSYAVVYARPAKLIKSSKR